MSFFHIVCCSIVLYGVIISFVLAQKQSLAVTKYLVLFPFRIPVMFAGLMVCTSSALVGLLPNILNELGKAWRAPWLSWISSWAAYDLDYNCVVDFGEELIHWGAGIVPEQFREPLSASIAYLFLLPFRIVSLIVFCALMILGLGIILCVEPTGHAINWIGKKLNVVWMCWIGKPMSKFIDQLDGVLSPPMNACLQFGEKLWKLT